MPSIDLGSVVGPQGPQGVQGIQGVQGEQGPAGPNTVTGTTTTALSGVLFGNGTNVLSRALDDADGAASTTGANTVAGNLATVEASSTASKDYAPGEYLVYHYQLYKASTAISQGDTLEVGTNLDLAIYSEDVAAALDERTPLIGKGINLLDNWYFPNPVNQRGQSSYNTDGYSIDRWYLKWGTATFGSTGVTLVAPSNNGCQLVQEIGNGLASEFTGETITLSALYSSVSGTAGVGIALGSSISGNATGLGNNMISVAGLATMTVTVPTSASRLNFFANLTKDTTATLVAMKLEKGTQQTLARQVNGAWVLNDPATNYQQELAKCQRYFIRFKQVSGSAYRPGFGNAYDATVGMIFVPTPVTMRAPTSSPVVTFSKLYLQGSTDYHAISAIQECSIGTTAVWLGVTSSGLTAGQSYLLTCDGSNGSYSPGDLTISCDL